MRRLIAKRVRKEYEEEQTKARALKKIPHLRTLPNYWSIRTFTASTTRRTRWTRDCRARNWRSLPTVWCGCRTASICTPKLAKLLEQRAEMGHGKRAVDYGFAEALAFASLVLEGTPIRLTGQDSQRGTFNQRHAVLIDTETEHNYLPLSHLSRQQAFCEIHNSPLSEAGCVGFEYGFSRDYPEALVLWEAQFGDFANGAQVIIDQFISASEDKWNSAVRAGAAAAARVRGPGAGALQRADRAFLQLAAEDNLQICQPSTPRSIFTCCGGKRGASGGNR